MSEQPEPTWQPLSKLPLIAYAQRGMREAADDVYHSLMEAKPKPHVLDDATIARVIRVHTAQRDDLWLYAEQHRRWLTQQPTEAQRQEIERLDGELTHLRATLDAVLALADELKDQTIERTLAKSDLELGIEAAVRWTRPTDE